jgi:putative ABC transport system permease protein
VTFFAFAREIRGLRRTPGFALTASLTLALGIGLSTAVFTIAESVLIRRLPVADQDRLILLWGETRDGRFANVPVALSDIRIIERNSTTLAEVAFFPFRGAVPVPIRDQDRVYPVKMGMVSGNYFAVLGTRASIGRTLRAEDDVAGAHPVVVISHRTWQQHFGGDPGVVGRSITTIQNGRSHTIVGVIPQGIEYPHGVELWAPIIAYSTAGGFHDIITNELDMLARLRRNASPPQARAELTRYFARSDAPPMQRNVIGSVHHFANELLGDTRPALLLIGLAAALLLFISCVNVANLLLVRALGQAREFAVRSAIGASRGRLIIQSLVESGVLAVTGGVIGLGFAIAALRAFVALVPANVPGVGEIAVNREMLLVAMGVTVLAMLLSAVGPALFTSRVDGDQLLRSGSRSTGGSGIRRVLEGLVAAQIALAVVSLMAAGLMTRSFYRLTNPDLAFQARGLLAVPLTATTELPENRTQAALDLAMERVQSLPDVRAVSLAHGTPFVGGGGGIDGRLSAPGQSREERSRNPMLNLEIAAPNYFSTLGIPILRGRAFTDADREGSSPVVIVSSSVARHFWPHEDPIGKRLVSGNGQVSVVGIVPDARYRDLFNARSSAYFPLRQSPFGGMLPTTLVIRAGEATPALVSQLRRVVKETSPGLEVVSATSVESLLEDPRASARLNAIVLTFFAMAALSLAALGLFAIIVTMVRQRTHELGIRMALGASAGDVRALVMRRGASLALIGGVVGIATALATSRLLSALLFDTQPTDVVTLVGVATTMLVVALLASLLPARSSTRIDPVIALRSEA